MKGPIFFTAVLALILTIVQCEPLAPTVPSTRLPEPTNIAPAQTPLPQPTPTEDPRHRVETTAKGLTSKDPGQATAADAQTALTLAGEAQKLGLDNGAKDLLEWLKKVLTLLTEAALKKNPCDATLDDVRRAIELAGEAQKLGLDDLANRLITWAKSGLQSYAAGRVAAGADAQERTALAAEAQKLGLDQLAQDLMAGKAIASACEETWEGVLEWEEVFMDAYSRGMSCADLGFASTGLFFRFRAKGHMDFTFLVTRDGKITGKATVSVQAVDRPIWKGGCGLQEYPATVPPIQFEGTVSGQKKGNTFDLRPPMSEVWYLSAKPDEAQKCICPADKAEYLYKGPKDYPVPAGPAGLQIDLGLDALVLPAENGAHKEASAPWRGTISSQFVSYRIEIKRLR